jgi:hypothetical protein
MVDAMDLKMWHRGHFLWRHQPTKFHENPPMGSVVTGGGGTDRLVILQACFHFEIKVG